MAGGAKVLLASDAWAARIEEWCYAGREGIVPQTPWAIEKVRLGDWCRRVDHRGEPCGPILVVVGFQGWLEGGRWISNLGDPSILRGRGGANLSDGMVGYPEELFWGDAFWER